VRKTGNVNSQRNPNVDLRWRCNNVTKNPPMEPLHSVLASISPKRTASHGKFPSVFFYWFTKRSSHPSPAKLLLSPGRDGSARGIVNKFPPAAASKGWARKMLQLGTLVTRLCFVCAAGEEEGEAEQRS
jgi:hypothetical protein